MVGTLFHLEKFRSLTQGLSSWVGGRGLWPSLCKHPHPMQEECREMTWVLHLPEGGLPADNVKQSRDMLLSACLLPPWTAALGWSWQSSDTNWELNKPFHLYLWGSGILYQQQEKSNWNSTSKRNALLLIQQTYLKLHKTLARIYQ